jgi:hypothetical protein
MENEKALTYWINATLSCKASDCAGSYSWTVLQEHFASQEGALYVDITDTQMLSMVGPGSIFLSYLESLEA